MPKPDASSSSPVVFVWGEDEFTVKQRAKEIYQQWCAELGGLDQDRKSTRLNSSHSQISYAVFCLKKKKNEDATLPNPGQPAAYDTVTHHTRAFVIDRPLDVVASARTTGALPDDVVLLVPGFQRAV